MKKYYIMIILILFSQNIFAQNNSIPEPTQSVTVPYRLFRTQNMWAFLELETATGRIWQVHFDVNGDNRIRIVLNSRNLAEGRDVIQGRFTLHPTANINNFILHDQIDGKTWQVQWSNTSRNRLIIPITE